MSKKNKFDLKALVTQGTIKRGETLYFVSDPKKTCVVEQHPGGDYKVRVAGEKELMTVHTFAQKCLGMDPPDHAAKWLRTTSGTTLYDLWHAEDDLAQAA